MRRRHRPLPQHPQVLRPLPPQPERQLEPRPLPRQVRRVRPRPPPRKAAQPQPAAVRRAVQKRVVGAGGADYDCEEAGGGY